MAVIRETFVEKKDTRPLFDPEVTVVMTGVWAISLVRVAVAIAHREYLGAEVTIACLIVVVGLALALQRRLHIRRDQ